MVRQRQQVVILEPRQMVRHFVAKSFRKCFFNKEDLPPKMAIFQRPTVGVNNTPSAKAHFQRLRTPAHAVAHSLFPCVAQTIRFISAPQKEVTRSHCDLHRSLAWTLMHNTAIFTPIPLSTSTTRRPMSQTATICQRTPAKETCFGTLPD